MYKILSYTVDRLSYEAPCWVPPFIDKPGPAIIVFPNLWGPNAYWDKMLEKYAALGYVTMIVDMYGKDTRPETFEEAFEVIDPLKVDRDAVRIRATAALGVLRNMKEVDSSRVVAAGYCFGGMCVLELARISAPVLGVVSFHGSLGSPMPITSAGSIEPSVLALHGAEDPSIPDAEVASFIDEMRTAGADWQLVHFGGQVHAFSDRTSNRPGVAVYDALTDRRSWLMMTHFIAEKLKPEEP